MLCLLTHVNLFVKSMAVNPLLTMSPARQETNAITTGLQKKHKAFQILQGCKHAHMYGHKLLTAQAHISMQANRYKHFSSKAHTKSAHTRTSDHTREKSNTHTCLQTNERTNARTHAQEDRDDQTRHPFLFGESLLAKKNRSGWNWTRRKGILTR